MFPIIPHRKFFLSLALLLVLASLVVLVVWGLNFGIDFTGGSLAEITYLTERPSNEEVRSTLESLGLGRVVVQPTGEAGVLMRFKAVDEDTHQAVLRELRTLGELREDRFESIEPTVGQELQEKARIALAVAIVFIILFIAWAFRKVSKPVASWKYGLVAIAALIHDIAIPTGIVSVLGQFGSFQVDAFFITALLTILGFSVHDTIVVFDRIRENLLVYPAESFENVANRSINEVLARSVNTSLTLLFVLLAVFILGGATTKGLLLVLILGVFFGTYSSIFVASPLLTVWARYGRKR